MASLVPPGIRHEIRGSSRKSGSTLQKIAQKKEQLRHYPRIKKLERIATHLHCKVRNFLFIPSFGLFVVVPRDCSQRELSNGLFRI